MIPKNNAAQDTSDREIVITRVLSAPRELAWEAWTNPKHVSHWWGPRGFTTTTHEIAMKPGGAWRFVMHGPDGTNYDNLIVYSDIVKPERLVYLHGSGQPDDPAQFHVTVTFEAMGEKTKVTLRSIFATPEQRAEVLKFGAVEGGKQTLERLDEHLANMGAVTKPFEISREFAAPRDLVFKVWTDREHLMRWWGPKGVTIVSCHNDLRVGGTMHYLMRTPDGHDMWGKWVYRDIIPPERLVFVNSFSDEKGGVTRHPMAPEWPQELLSTITFTEHEGRTTVTVRWVPIDANAAERATFDGGRDSMRGGWTGTLDQLADYLGNLRSTEAAR